MGEKGEGRRRGRRRRDAGEERERGRLPEKRGVGKHRCTQTSTIAEMTATVLFR